MSQQWEMELCYNVFNAGTLNIYWLISARVDLLSYIRKYNLQTWKIMFIEICGMPTSPL